MSTPKLNGNYQQFIQDLTLRIQTAQYTALKTVNHELLTLYWYIGQQLVEKQLALGWGKSVVEQISSSLEINVTFEIKKYAMRSLQTSHHYYAVSDRECEGCGQRPRNSRPKFVNFAQHIIFFCFTKSIVYIILPTYLLTYSRQRRSK